MRTRSARRTLRVWLRLSRIATETVTLTVRTPRARRRRSVVALIVSANVRRPATARRRVTVASVRPVNRKRGAVAALTVIFAVARHAIAHPTVNVARPRTFDAAIDAVGRENACVGAVPLPGGVPPAAGATTFTVEEATNVRPPRKSVAPTRGWKVPGVGYD